MKPIRIYLDTSDYIRMLSKNLETEIIETQRQLLKWIDEGKIETGYSFWLITELVKDGNIEFKEDRRRKGRLLKQFSRRKAFPHILDLHKGHKFPNDGIWMPRSTFRKLSLNILRPQLKAEISKRPEFNRELRRKLSSPSGFRDAILSRGLGKKLTKQDFGSIPVTNEFIEGQYLNRFRG